MANGRRDGRRSTVLSKCDAVFVGRHRWGGQEHLGVTKDVQSARRKLARMLRTRERATTWMLRCRITLPQSRWRCGHPQWMHCFEVVALKNRSEALPLVILMKLKNVFERSIGAFVALSLKKQHTWIGADWGKDCLRDRAFFASEEDVLVEKNTYF